MSDAFQVGQRAVINRAKVVTIEKVTRSGRIIADGRTFEADGVERVSGGTFGQRFRLEALTPEIEAAMALFRRGLNGRKKLREAIGNPKSIAAIEDTYKLFCSAYDAGSKEQVEDDSIFTEKNSHRESGPSAGLMASGFGDCA